MFEDLMLSFGTETSVCMHWLFNLFSVVFVLRLLTPNIYCLLMFVCLLCSRIVMLLVRIYVDEPRLFNQILKQCWILCRSFSSWLCLIS